MNHDPNDPFGGTSGFDPLFTTTSGETTPPDVDDPIPGYRYRDPNGTGWWEWLEGRWSYYYGSTAGRTQTTDAN